MTRISFEEICSRRGGLLSANQQDKVTVHIKYKDVEQTFAGNVNEVWTGVNRFFNEMIPALDIVGKVLITVDLEKLIKDCDGIIAVSPEGPTILVNKKVLTDSETLTLHLLAAYIGYKLGLFHNDALAKEELQASLGKSSKITSTRLGELCREGLAIKMEEGRYRVTTFGIRRLQKEILPRISVRLQT
jgi:hypothetical protein